MIFFKKKYSFNRDKAKDYLVELEKAMHLAFHYLKMMRIAMQKGYNRGLIEVHELYKYKPYVLKMLERGFEFSGDVYKVLVEGMRKCMHYLMAKRHVVMQSRMYRKRVYAFFRFKKRRSMAIHRRLDIIYHRKEVIKTKFQDISDELFTPILLGAFMLSTLGLASCSAENKDVSPKDWLAKGADVSWLTQMEHDGLLFYDANGSQMECMELLRSLGMNAIRLRVFVNPKDNWCNKEDVLVKARRAQQLGMDIMIDFHYSDVWADPGHQTKPVKWASLSFDDLKEALVVHTTETLNLLLKNGIQPKWVQIGNETSDGMLWEEGRASKNMKNFAALVEAGHLAVKAVSKDIITIVHLNSGENKGMYRWLFDGLKKYNAHYDRIGMSLYPKVNDWQTTTDDCLSTIKDVSARYDKKVLICEVGMSWRLQDTSFAFLDYLISEVRALKGRPCVGVFYWEPQNHSAWSSYSMGAFNNKGRPTRALDAFKK